MPGTVYDIRLRYNMEGRATRQLKQFNAGLQRSTRSAGMLSGVVGRLGGLFAAGLGFRAAKRALLDYNSTMEQARTTTAGLLMMNLDGSFEQNLGKANKVVAELQQRAAKSTATTQEMVQFMSEIVQPVTKAGLKVKDLAAFTAQAVVAAKAFGDEQIAAFDIQQALTQTVKLRDRFTRKLLVSAKVTREEFNKMDTAKRLETLQRALNSPAIAALAAKQAKTFAGITSTFKDQAQILMGKVGLPLFKGVTAELIKWTGWISKNGDKLDRMAKSFGQSIASGFVAVKNAVGFLIRHKSIIFAIGAAMAVRRGAAGLSGMMRGGMVGRTVGLGGFQSAVRGVGMASMKGAMRRARAEAAAAGMGTVGIGHAGRMAGRAAKAQYRRQMMQGGADMAILAAQRGLMASALQRSLGVTDKFNLTMAGIGGAATALPGKLGLFGMALTGGITVVNAFFSWLNSKQKTEQKAQFEIASVLDADMSTKRGRMVALAGLTGGGFITKEGKLNEAKLVKTLTKANITAGRLDREGKFFTAIAIRAGLDKGASKIQDRAEIAKVISNMRDVVGLLSTVSAETRKILGGGEPGPGKDLPGNNTEKKPPDVNIKMEIQVESNDPDRFVMGLGEALADAVKNQNSAWRAVGER